MTVIMIRPGGDELHVVVAADLADAPADQAAEDDEIQRGGHRRRQDGLAPDAHDAAELADDDGLEADPVGAAHAMPRRHGMRAARAGRARCARFSTSRMNSSSSRLTLLRMLSTSMPSRRQAREDLVQVLLLRHLHLQRVCCPAASRRTRQLRRAWLGVAQIEHEDLGLQLAQHVAPCCRAR